MHPRLPGPAAAAVVLALLSVAHLNGQAPAPAQPAQGVAVTRPATPASGTATLPPPPLPIGTPVEELPRFEVASVKKPTGPTTSQMLRVPGGGRITIGNLPLRLIITQAFGIRDTQIVGAPGWLSTDRFSITAKAETNAPRDQLMLMLRALLVERFGFKFHVETRDQQAYVLTAPEGWQPNDRIQAVDCTTPKPETAPPAGPIRPAQMPCGSLSLSNNVISARGLTFASFASLLGSIGGLGQVHDRTNLPGTYTFQLEASILLGRSAALLSAAAGAASPLTGTTADLLPTLPEGPSLGSAVEDLGLKLVRRTEKLDVLVIDSISQPDED